MYKIFNNYINSFDISNDKIMQKVDHSLRVAKLMREYSKRLGYSKEEEHLAELVGLFHDIGRFNQLKKTDSYTDTKECDHADEGINVLFKEGLIEDLDISKKYYEEIEFSIKNHNKYSIEQVSNRKMMKIAKLIRDIDKIDILYQLGVKGLFNEKSDNSEINPNIMKCFKNFKTAKWDDVKTNNDKIALRFAMSFDINNDMCLKEYKKYLVAYYKRIEKNDTFKEIYKITLNYINERIDSIC